MTSRSDDWRLRGQEGYLGGAILVRKSYARYSTAWEHDHCEFCTAKFMPQAMAASRQVANEQVFTEGYTTTAEHPKGPDYYWICDPCYNDFRDRFGWTVVAKGAQS